MPNDASVRRRIATDLRDFTRILSEERKIKDPAPLYDAEAQLRRWEEAGTWGYSIQGLSIDLPTDYRHTIPRNVSSMRLVMDITVKGICEADFDRDPLLQLGFDILVEGKTTRKGVSRRHEQAWHLDRDLSANKESTTNGGKQEYMHPRYHFQYGGKRLVENDYGSSLVLETPRLAHPPLDGILGVDFVLTNYFTAEHTAFRHLAQYANILRRAQERLWQPYARIAASDWRHAASANTSWHATAIWPQIIPPR